MALETEHIAVRTTGEPLLRSAGNQGVSGAITTGSAWSAHPGLLVFATGYQWFYNGWLQAKNFS